MPDHELPPLPLFSNTPILQRAFESMVTDYVHAIRAPLLKKIEALEELRPMWAQGYSDDSVAAQTSTAALKQLWDILGVADQTNAVIALQALVASDEKLYQDNKKLKKRMRSQRTELRRLNKCLGPYWAGFNKGIDFKVSTTLRAAMQKAFGYEAVRDAEKEALGGKL